MRRASTLGWPATQPPPPPTFVVKDLVELHNSAPVPNIKIQPSERAILLRHKRHDTGVCSKLWKVVYLLADTWEAGHNVWQAVHTFSSALFTHAVAYRGLAVGPSLAQAIINTLAGLVAPQVNVSIACGSYLGMGSPVTIPSFAWLCLSAAILSALWMVFIRFKILVGIGGRLGVCVFLAHNFTIITILAPAGFVPWGVYYKPTFWKGLTYEPALVSIAGCSVTCLCVKLVRELFASLQNAVTAASAVGLLFSLVVSITEYYYADVLIVGIIVGSLTGMSADTVLASRLDFFGAGLMAGGVMQLMYPFFLGLGGFDGVRAMLGVFLWKALVSIGQRATCACRCGAGDEATVTSE